ncbi:DUF475 domain-containing protein [Rhodococcus sp. X156]|uniref:DUF475 domain-containing protein n=1 Tax=Rhodococcus sp. X156 TaxID=2499145 RepID=UPI000FDBEA03|nr:DUF475 domain-containing protein [Rhodococcus sp. X156]
MFRIFGWSVAITIAALVGTLLVGGPAALTIVAILIVLEVSLSFDNAVVNAKVLVRMNEFWQRLFLTVGVLIAVFGMRLIFPLLLVAVTAKISPVEVVSLALEGGSIDEPGTYANLINAAHPAIAGFGGMFLGMLFLDWLFEQRDITWLSWLERPLARIGALKQVSVAVALIALALAAGFFGPHAHSGDKSFEVLLSGVLGIVTYLVVNGLGSLFEGAQDDDDEAELVPVGADARQPDGSALEPAGAAGSGPSTLAKASGKAAFFLFLYLEVLDASFSFDGVVGAFAITQDIFIIAIGLGVGAFWIRSLTVYLVRKGTLEDYVYLEHGAHWAIGALAVLLLVTVEYEVPEVITGLIGVGFIGAAFINSVIRNKKVGERPHTFV